MVVLGLQQMLSTVKTHKITEQQLSDMFAENNTLQTSVEEHQRIQDNLNAVLQDEKETLQRENERSTRRKNEIQILQEAQFNREEEIKKQVTDYEGKILALGSNLKALEISYKQSVDQMIAQQKEQMEKDQKTTLLNYEDIIENLNRTLNAFTKENELQIEKITDLETQLQKKSVELETIQKHQEQVLSEIMKIATCGIDNAGFESSKQSDKTELKNIGEEVLTKLTDRLRHSGALTLDDEERSMLHHVQGLLEAEIQSLKYEIQERKHSQMTAEEFGNSQIDYLEQQIQKQRTQQLVAESFANEEITKLEDNHEERKRLQTTAEVFAEKELDKLEFQLKEQITKRRFVEKYAYMEIRKLEANVEDKNRSLNLAEAFADTKISILETKIEKKESTLKLVKRFTDAEITRLERNQWTFTFGRHLGSRGFIFKKIKVAENDNSQTHLITSLKALDELQNTVVCLQKRIKELETNNARYDGVEPSQLTKDNGPEEMKRNQVGVLNNSNLRSSSCQLKRTLSAAEEKAPINKARVFNAAERAEFQQMMLDEINGEAGFNGKAQMEQDEFEELIYKTPIPGLRIEKYIQNTSKNTNI